jgi:hypothetical protein
VERSLQHIILAKNIIICGDFNAYYLWWNSAVSDTAVIRATTLIDWLNKFHFNLISKPNNETFYRNNLIRDSVINLVFNTYKLSQYVSW